MPVSQLISPHCVPIIQISGLLNDGHTVWRGKPTCSVLIGLATPRAPTTIPIYARSGSIFPIPASPFSQQAVSPRRRIAGNLLLPQRIDRLHALGR